MKAWCTSVIAALSVGLWCALPTNAGLWYNPTTTNQEAKNDTGQTVNDFTMILSDPNYNPDVTKPEEVYFGKGGFAKAERDVGEYYFANPGPETRIRWSGSNIGPNQRADIGLALKGKGVMLDAWWTINGVRTSWTPPIIMETTRIETTRSPGMFDLHMELNVVPGFFSNPDNPQFPTAQAGWTNIRTFIDIPEGTLSLVNLNSDLDLASLLPFETTPRLGGPGGAVIDPLDTFLVSDDSIFDVYAGATAFASPLFESLLVADVVSEGTFMGYIYKLNPQKIPEPSTLGLLVLGGISVCKRRRP